jgi:hypothetical protein
LVHFVRFRPFKIVHSKLTKFVTKFHSHLKQNFTVKKGIVFRPRLFGDTTISIMTLSIMTLSIMTLSIMTLSIMTLSIMTLSMRAFSITIN